MCSLLYHVERNPADRCREVTRNVRRVDGDFSKIQLLTGLSGFKAPTASCVLAALSGERHAVVDTRVWASLERKGYLEGRKESFDAADYVAMIEPIRDIAAETGYSAVEVGYALFAYDDRVRTGRCTDRQAATLAPPLRRSALVPRSPRGGPRTALRPARRRSRRGTPSGRRASPG